MPSIGSLKKNYPNWVVDRLINSSKFDAESLNPLMKRITTTFLSLATSSLIFSQLVVDRLPFNNTADGMNNTATMSGTETYVADRMNDADSALYLDGSSYANYADINVNPTTGFTYSFWIKPDAADKNTKVIFSQRGTCSNSNAIEAYYHGLLKTISFSHRTAAGAATGIHVEGIATGTWQRITFTLDPTTKKISAYKNGEYHGASAPVNGTLASSLSGSFMVGNHVCVGVDATSRFAGAIDDLVITDTYLDAITIKASLTDFNEDNYSAALVDSGAVFCEKFTPSTEYVQNRNAEEGLAQRFDGTRSINAPKSNLSIANGFSASFWVKPEAQSGQSALFSERSLCTDVDFFNVGFNGTVNSISMSLRKKGVGAASVATNVTLNDWQKITFTINPANGEYISYLNGEAVDTSIVDLNKIPASFSGTKLDIGSSACVGSDITKGFLGSLDDLTLYDRVLSPSEITAAFNADSDNVLNPNYVYDFTTYSRIDNDGDASPALNAGGAVKDIGNPDIRSKVGYTWSFWLNTNTVTSNEVIMQKRSVCNHDNMFSFHVLNDNTIHGEFRTSGQQAHSQRIDFTANEWQNFTYVANRKNNTLYAYLDGVLFGTSTFDAADFPDAYTTGINLRIGYDICSSYKPFEGSVDDIKIYNVPLSEKEVKHLVGVEKIITATEDEILSDNNMFLVSPNPASDVINVLAGAYQLLNSNGDLVSSGISKGTIDVSNLTSGLYIVKIDGKFGKVIIE